MDVNEVLAQADEVLMRSQRLEEFRESISFKDRHKADEKPISEIGGIMEDTIKSFQGFVRNKSDDEFESTKRNSSTDEQS